MGYTAKEHRAMIRDWVRPLGQRPSHAVLYFHDVLLPRSPSVLRPLRPAGEVKWVQPGSLGRSAACFLQFLSQLCCTCLARRHGLGTRSYSKPTESVRQPARDATHTSRPPGTHQLKSGRDPLAFLRWTGFSLSMLNVPAAPTTAVLGKTGTAKEWENAAKAAEARRLPLPAPASRSHLLPPEAPAKKATATWHSPLPFSRQRTNKQVPYSDKMEKLSGGRTLRRWFVCWVDDTHPKGPMARCTYTHAHTPPSRSRASCAAGSAVAPRSPSCTIKGLRARIAAEQRHSAALVSASLRARRH